MVEAGATIIIAIVTGIGAATRHLQTRIDALDTRIDKYELRIAENYLTKADFSLALDRVEAHMVRIENKLDKLVT